LKNKLKGLIKLLRYKEYFFFVIVTTLLGAKASYGYFGWELVGVLVANWLAVGFAFMVNDIEDADDDSLNPAKVNRNPISAKMIGLRDAWFASSIVCLISAILFALAGWLSFITGMVSLLFGLLYSWKKVRFKNTAILDMFTHCLMLAGFQFLTAFLLSTGSKLPSCVGSPHSCSW